MKSPYTWHVHQRNGLQFCHASDCYTLKDAIVKYDNVKWVSFTSHNGFPPIHLQIHPDKEIIFGIYCQKNVEEWCRLSLGDTPPKENLLYQLIGWIDHKKGRKFVIAIELDTGIIRMQGE